MDSGGQECAAILAMQTIDEPEITMSAKASITLAVLKRLIS